MKVIKMNPKSFKVDVMEREMTHFVTLKDGTVVSDELYEALAKVWKEVGCYDDQPNDSVKLPDKTELLKKLKQKIDDGTADLGKAIEAGLMENKNLAFLSKKDVTVGQIEKILEVASGV